MTVVLHTALIIAAALQQFAYDFVQAADIEDQNEILVTLLQRVTSGQPVETNQKTIDWFANVLESDPVQVRKFAKQEGIRC